MVTPTFHDIFFDNDFTEDMIPELEEAQSGFNSALEKAASAYNIPFSEADEIRCANNSEHVMAQYLGFMQGFKWAVYLFTGHTDSDKEGNQKCL